ncbi:LysE family translocator [Rhizobium binae]|uniref:Threonine/homoserine/homoserine lactone efflux protein n=1 Tax=Rhizobium binae TaxID=1138190 RepID=A0ABV2MDW6_9HYPH|nr:LysE family translocator [Rhizobium binae]NKL46982.1 LysE family translocator [Rhizobium leguminosarum bv. viciae]MBX4936689.1 LysE family translocator [Rhizobium binae]MBX4943013.1 LysE family translocator [Rhizobium binae]MBX4964255.1 LysE family translocator [Rhizobium binae]MBX4971573.1 LysE family translocator [Rhizobium binae]
MLDYSLAHWLAFLSAAVLLNLSPGPDIAFILGHTMRGGKRAGFAALFGVWSGACLHVLMAALGLSALLAASAVAFSAVKWVGAAYLFWLGIQALRAGGSGNLMKAAGEKMPVGKIYRQGILVSLLNPKVAIFFLAFLPQFVVEGAGPVWAQLMLHGGLIIGVAAFIEPPLVLLGGRLADMLKNNQEIERWLDRGLGALFVALGVRLALTSH